MNIFKPRVLLSGASGFTGSNLIELLINEDYEIFTVQRPSNKEVLQEWPKINQIDVNDKNEVNKLLMEGNVVSVIHLATLYCRTEHPSLFSKIWQANYELGKELLEIAFRGNAQFIHIESFLQFENEGSSEYLASKRRLSNEIDQLRSSIEIPISSLVFFDNYGPGDRRGKFIDQLIVARLQGKTLSIENPEKLIILTHIEDVVHAICRLIKVQSEGRFRVNAEEKYLVGELAQYIGNFPSKRNLVSQDYNYYAAENFQELDCFQQKNNLVSYIRSQLSEVLEK